MVAILKDANVKYSSFNILEDEEVRQGKVYLSCHDKTNKMTCAPSKDSDQPGHPPSLLRVFAVHFMGS